MTLLEIIIPKVKNWQNPKVVIKPYIHTAHRDEVGSTNSINDCVSSGDFPNNIKE